MPRSKKQVDIPAPPNFIKSYGDLLIDAPAERKRIARLLPRISDFLCLSLRYWGAFLLEPDDSWLDRLAPSPRTLRNMKCCAAEPGSLCGGPTSRDPGSAPHHCVLRCARDDAVRGRFNVKASCSSRCPVGCSRKFRYVLPPGGGRYGGS